MEKTASNIVNIGSKNYHQPIYQCIEEIKSILSMHDSYSGNEIIEKINKKADEIIHHFLHIKEVYKHDTKKLLPMVLEFFQNLYSNFNMTYFYNRSPEISHEEYDNLHTGQQVLNNVFDGNVYIKKHCLIKEDYIMGGNCHYWNLAIKKIFDTINLPGLVCKINVQGHAFVSIYFEASTWIIDLLPQTKELLDKKIYVLDEQTILKYGTAGHYQVLDEENSSLNQYNSRKIYKNNLLNNLVYDSIRLSINNIKLEITQSTIMYKYKDIDKSEREIFLSINLRKELDSYNKIELLEEIFSGIKVFPRHLIPLISRKISEKQLFDLFKK